jgi:hypothetical protein
MVVRVFSLSLTVAYSVQINPNSNRYSKAALTSTGWMNNEVREEE